MSSILLFLYHSSTFIQGIKIEKIVVHPDFWSDKTKHGNSYDLALVKTSEVMYARGRRRYCPDKDVYTGPGVEKDGMMIIHPICSRKICYFAFCDCVNRYFVVSLQIIVYFLDHVVQNIAGQTGERKQLLHGQSSEISFYTLN